VGKQSISNNPPRSGHESASSQRPAAGQGKSAHLPPSGSPGAAGGVGLTRQECGECLLALAHRFSQPITALRGSLELALAGALSTQEYRAALEQAFELAGQLVQLVKSLRELGDAAAPGAPAKSILLNALVKEALEELRGFAEARRVKIVFEASPEAIVCGPPDRFREVMLKLLWVAIERSPAQGEIRLALSNSGGSATLILADQGARPRPNEVDLASSGEGGGLGRLFSECAKTRRPDWAILKTLAESLGGSLQVKARDPQGCSFLLRLPLAGSQKS